MRGILDQLTLDEFLDGLAVLDSLAFTDQIHLVLQNDNVLGVDSDDFQRGEMFTSLGLRTRLVSGNEQESTVHYLSACHKILGWDDILTAAPVNMVAMRMS